MYNLVLTNNGYKYELDEYDRCLTHTGFLREYKKFEDSTNTHMVYTNLSNIPIYCTLGCKFLMRNNKWTELKNIVPGEDIVNIKLLNNRFNTSDDMQYVYGYVYKNYNNLDGTLIISNNKYLINLNKILKQNGFKPISNRKRLYNYNYIIDDIKLLYQFKWIVNESNFHDIISNMSVDSIKFFMAGYLHASEVENYLYNPFYNSKIKKYFNDNILLIEYSMRRALFIQYISLYTHKFAFIKKMNDGLYQLIKTENNQKTGTIISVVKIKKMKTECIKTDIDSSIMINNIIINKN